MKKDPLLSTTLFFLLGSLFVFAEQKTEDQGIVYFLKQKFVEGDPRFMSLILICLILGLAFVIERIIYLNLSDVNTDKLVATTDKALKENGVEAAKDYVRGQSGPVASVFYQGLLRVGQGQSVDEIEKSVIAYGGVEIGRLERNLSWISLFISIAPMLGFMGTVYGMILAFDDIQAAGTVDPTDMAGNIKVALLTTIFGLIVAIILQIFYNYLLAKIDSIVNKMEDATIQLVDVLVTQTKK